MKRKETGEELDFKRRKRVVVLKNVSVFLIEQT